MSDFWINLIAVSTAKATASFVVTLPFAFVTLWLTREAGYFNFVGWPDPTNAQMLLIAVGVAVIR